MLPFYGVVMQYRADVQIGTACGEPALRATAPSPELAVAFAGSRHAVSFARIHGSPLPCHGAGTATGQAAPDSSEPVATRSSLREGVFRFDGRETWEIGLNGQVGWYSDLHGLHQAHYLLQRVGQRVPVIELAQLGGEQVVINRRCAEDVADPEALAQYRAQLEKLEDQKTTANNNGDWQIVEAVEAEMEVLERHIRSARSPSGNPRQLRDQRDQLRQRVCYTLRFSLGKIIAQAPELGEHLIASIHLGYQCGYIPAAPVHWVL